MPITINKETDHFFISIAKVDSHSFLMLGTYYQHKVTNLLCRVGKVFDNSDVEKVSLNGSLRACVNPPRALFSSSKGRVQDEGTFKK